MTDAKNSLPEKSTANIHTAGKIIRLLFLALFLAVSACVLIHAGNVSAASSLTTSVKTLAVGKSYTIRGYADVQSSKTNVAIATQKSNGAFKISALKKGRTPLTLYDSDGQKVGKIYLLVTNSKSFVYDTSALSLMAGETKKVQATVQNGCTVKYKSSDKSVATVTSSGKIKAVSSGTVTISAKVYYKGTRVKTLKKQVTVTTDIASTTLKTLLQTALEPVGSTMDVHLGRRVE
ncbi:MAG: Ig-like domain-containing protein [Lachnospiraceae bacterium]|nr:Ig-like domain-containing protein [Lachnospiraceae bacterium]